MLLKQWKSIFCFSICVLLLSSCQAGKKTTRTDSKYPLLSSGKTTEVKRDASEIPKDEASSTPKADEKSSNSINTAEKISRTNRVIVNKPLEDKSSITPSVSNNIPSIETINVKQLQVLLYFAGHKPGKVNGTFHEQTADAIKAYQKVNQLSIGELDQSTIDFIGLNAFTTNVGDIQSALTTKGYDPGPIDGLIGPMTKGALDQFREQHGFQGAKWTKELQTALLSNAPQYKNKAAKDPLFDTSGLPKNNIYLPLNEKIDPKLPLRSSIISALHFRGYPADVPQGESWSDACSDALFRFQLDNNLPLGQADPISIQYLNGE